MVSFGQVQSAIEQLLTKHWQVWLGSWARPLAIIVQIEQETRPKIVLATTVVPASAQLYHALARIMYSNSAQLLVTICCTLFNSLVNTNT